jgi:hypothetical protein
LGSVGNPAIHDRCSGPEALRPHLSMGLPKRARAVCAGDPSLPIYIYFDIAAAPALA